MSEAPLPSETRAALGAMAPLAGGSDQAFHHEVTTGASPEAIWALWMDVPGWGCWDAGLKSASSRAPLARGVTGRIVPQRGPAARFVVSAFAPSDHYAFETALPLARLTVRRTIIATSPTVIRHDVAFSGLLAGFWAARFGPGFRRALPPTMDRLVALAGDAR